VSTIADNITDREVNWLAEKRTEQAMNVEYKMRIAGRLLLASVVVILIAIFLDLRLHFTSEANVFYLLFPAVPLLMSLFLGWLILMGIKEIKRTRSEKMHFLVRGLDNNDILDIAKHRIRKQYINRAMRTWIAIVFTTATLVTLATCCYLAIVVHTVYFGLPILLFITALFYSGHRAYRKSVKEVRRWEARHAL
jgi:cation transport ATPase